MFPDPKPNVYKNTIAKYMKHILQALYVIMLPSLVVYPTLRVYEHLNKLQFLQRPSDGSNFFYYFIAMVSLVMCGIGYWIAFSKVKLKMTANFFLSQIGVRIFVVMGISHIWSEFVINTWKGLGLVTTTSLLYTVIVIDIGMDHYYLDTGFPEAAFVGGIRFFINFYKEKGAETAWEVIFGKFSFSCTIIACFLVYVLKWLEPTLYLSLEGVNRLAKTSQQRIDFLEKAVNKNQRDIQAIFVELDYIYENTGIEKPPRAPEPYTIEEAQRQLHHLHVV